MTLLHPWALAAGGVVATAIVGLHLLAVGLPRTFALPTARFAPARTVRATALARRPTDLPLLALRVAAVLLAALAAAHPVRTPARRAVARIVVADRSRGAAPGAVRGALDTLARAGDVVIAFDTVAGAAVTVPAERAAIARALDAAVPTSSTEADGSLSAALAAARRAAPSLARAADSLELVIVSPLAAAEADAATGALRAAWAGRARVVRVPSRTMEAADTLPPRAALLGAPADDALAAALALDGVRDTGAAPRAAIVRDGSASGAAVAALVVDWPVDGVPARWTRRVPPDTVGALVVRDGGADVVVVAPFVRRAAAPASSAASARVVARWADGAPAAIDEPTGSGCVRHVAVEVPQAGDVALSTAFRRAVRALLAPCGGRAARAPLGDAAVARLAGVGPLLATRALVGDATSPASGAAPDRLRGALLAAALALLVIELPLRRRARRTSTTDERAAPTNTAAVTARPAA